jgi:predicted metal-binding membrane protein
MGTMPGTMGLELGAFVGVWTLMTAAMMLPSVAPVVGRLVQSGPAGAGAFTGGYLLVWVAAGFPAFGLAWLGGRLAADDPPAATALAVVLFAACGVYQLTGVKHRWLHRCREDLGSPTATRMSMHDRYGRELRLGARHGVVCLGSCWALMAGLFAFGLMNLLAMAVLSGAVFVEKVWVRGPWFAKVTGFVALALALAVVFVPGLAPGLQAPVHGSGAGGMGRMPGM